MWHRNLSYEQWSDTAAEYHFDRKFTNSENLLPEMADKISFELWRFKTGAFFVAVTRY